MLRRILCLSATPVVGDDDHHRQQGLTTLEEFTGFYSGASIPFQPLRSSRPGSGRNTPVAPRSTSNISETTYTRMSPTTKLEWLLQATRPQEFDANAVIRPIRAGVRSWNRKQALCYALELAIEHNREAVPANCRQLTEEYPRSDESFLLFGVSFDFGRLSNWARDGIHTTSMSIAKREIEDLGKEMYRSDSQNVHTDAVKIAMGSQLVEILDRVPPSLRVSQSTAEAEISDYLKNRYQGSQSLKRTALNGLKMVSDRPDKLSTFDQSVKGTLGILWNYIRTVPDPKVKEQLSDSMATKLREIKMENPCAIGMIERIIDIPTAIDWSITQKLSLEHLRTELQTLAGTINEEFEREIAEYIGSIRREKDQEHIAGNPEEIFTTMKRDRFLQTADIEFGMLRGIERQEVARHAKDIFPADMIL